MFFAAKIAEADTNFGAADLAFAGGSGALGGAAGGSVGGGGGGGTAFGGGAEIQRNLVGGRLL